MVSNEEAEFLARKNGKLETRDDAGKALAARLERRSLVRLQKMMDGSVNFTRTDLGYDALLQFEKAEADKKEQSKLSAVVARGPKSIWSFLNSNLITNVIVAIIAFALGKFF